jgi:hypothetical protein
MRLEGELTLAFGLEPAFSRFTFGGLAFGFEFTFFFIPSLVVQIDVPPQQLLLPERRFL